MGRTDTEAQATIRISLGRFTTAADIDYALTELIAAVERLRRSPAATFA
jgi:cysteine desulfurase